MAKKIIDVSISNLELDQENARFENQVVASQRDAIQHLLSIDNMSEKIARLAEHIAQYGDDPSELPLVIPNPKKEKSFIVVEGNRRVLALKLLKNPSLCPPGYKSLQKKLNQILAKAKVSMPAKLQCSLLASRESSNLWVELKHTGENYGAGRVDWLGTATDAFREKQGAVKSVGRIIQEYIAADLEFDDDLRAYAKTIKITNLTRLFGSSESMKQMGYKISGGKLFLHHSQHIFRRALEAVIFRFKENNINVGDIYDSKLIKRFFSDLIDKADLPGPQSGSSQPVNIVSSPDLGKIDNSEHLVHGTPSIEVGGASGVAVSLNTSEQEVDVNLAGGKRKSVKASNLRKHLINFTLKISQPRINNIYLELKNKIDINETPNSGSVLFRVFLELTTDHALHKLKLNTKAGIAKDSILRVKIDTVLIKLVEKNKIQEKVAADIKMLTSNTAFQSGTVDALHRFIHGANHPVAKDVNDIMDNWSPYFLAVWDYDADLGNGSGQG